jgi:hypothetical protein
MTDAAQLQLITLFSVIAGLVYQEIRASRQRRWDVEDRALLAVKADQQALHATTARNDMAVALAENTGLTKAAIASADNAFHEANTVNTKIERLATSANAAIAAEVKGERRLTDTVRADLKTATDLGLLPVKE